ncbi:MAG: GNAT family N-acetyltransferase [Nocardioidaceae bacterium]
MVTLRTKLGVRVLSSADLPEVERVLAQDPITNVFVDHRVRLTRLDSRWLGGEIWGYDDASGLVSMCHSAANLMPVQATPAALHAFAAKALADGRRCSAIIGPHADVAELWRILGPTWGPARSIRPRQPFLTLSAPPLVDPSSKVRRVRPHELDILYPACVAMFTEEVGVSPERDGGAQLYRARVAQLIAKGLAFAHIEGGTVIFKAEVGAVTPRATQVQGVWVAPEHRGQGIAAPSLAAVSIKLMREIAPVVSLYVNEHNVAARRAYATVGFAERTRFATVLF